MGRTIKKLPEICRLATSARKKTNASRCISASHGLTSSMDTSAAFAMPILPFWRRWSDGCAIPGGLQPSLRRCLPTFASAILVTGAAASGCARGIGRAILVTSAVAERTLIA